MTPRSFTVFLDEDAAFTTTSTTTIASTITTTTTTTTISRPSLKASASSPAILSTSTFSSTTLTDKENYDPLTGERAAAIGAQVSGKGVKRKGSVSSGSCSSSGGSVLVTKSAEVNVKENGIGLKEKEVLVLKEKVLKGKDMRDGSKEPEPKKRRSSVSSVSSTGSVSSKKAKGKKTSGGSGSAKKPTSSRKSSRTRTRASPAPVMPRVDEETEVEATVERLSQEQIDARCYDLTVSPLADVSEAYFGPTTGTLLSIVESPSSDEESVASGFNFVKEPSTEPELRDYDYFSLSNSGSSSTLRGSSPIPPSSNSSSSSVSEPKQFSTPERKRIYSAFTFTSPSPSSERYAQAKRETSVSKLDLS
ncbi:hypothetical protein D9758_003105 [Tetrapyrgos nigripes]|uniref:Uncharacterized protein n=1 Tax=Tetrapyrgos nigripes TaxID=182062 RepID=A0A8H5LTM3_9AGAR|nr:hypothetical protein D9758_003105 [Tetrapyrgos nigripes]